jgi:hypothetical protein
VKHRHLRCLSLCAITACAATDAHPPLDTPFMPTPALAAALAGITGDALQRHVSVLASDEFEGRGPGTRGEELTVAYLIEHLQRMGLEPGNPDGGWTQDVPLVSYRVRASATYRVAAATTAATAAPVLRSPEDFVIRDRQTVQRAHIVDAAMLFVGYGVISPEHDWDDYGDVDVRGRTLLMLQLPHTDTVFLRGRALTGGALSRMRDLSERLKVAEAKGAAAVVMVHDPALGYPYEYLVSLFDGTQTALRSGDGRGDGRGSMPAAWLRGERAAELVAGTGRSLDALRHAAAGNDFRPLSLPVWFSLDVESDTREFVSRNVIAKLTGSDRRLRGEYVLYSAHWDHLGRDTTLVGDQIYNGAMDNAGGTAKFLEIAGAFARLDTRPRRTLLFLATTAEESGLLGAQHYVAQPLYPLARTLAAINIDWFIPWGRTADVLNITAGHTTLDDVLAQAAAVQSRVVTEHAVLQQTYFRLSDHFAFAEAGVPGLFAGGGLRAIGQPDGYIEQRDAEYMERDYHQVSDEVREDWDYTGPAEDAQLLLMVGWIVAQSPHYPEWQPGTSYPEFSARRTAMLRGVRK